MVRTRAKRMNKTGGKSKRVDCRCKGKACVESGAEAFSGVILGEYRTSICRGANGLARGQLQDPALPR